MSALEYLWEEQLDNSQEDTTSLLIPNEVLFNSLGVKPGLVDGTFMSHEGRIVALDPSGDTSKQSFLVVNKEALEAALEQNGLEIFWTLLGEKMVVNNDRTTKTTYGRAEISIVATLECGAISTSKKVILSK